MNGVRKQTGGGTISSATLSRRSDRRMTTRLPNRTPSACDRRCASPPRCHPPVRRGRRATRCGPPAHSTDRCIRTARHRRCGPTGGRMDGRTTVSDGGVPESLVVVPTDRRQSVHRTEERPADGPCGDTPTDRPTDRWATTHPYCRCRRCGGPRAVGIRPTTRRTPARRRTR